MMNAAAHARRIYSDGRKIRVGHVEVEDFWVTVETALPSTGGCHQDVWDVSKDGTPVRCFRGDGTAVLVLVHPGRR